MKKPVSFFVGALLLSIGIGGCGGDGGEVNGPETRGSIRVTVDGTQSRAIDANEVLTIPNLPKGSHTIELSGIARNCTVLDSNPRDISITVGVTTHDSYHITCAPALLDRITYVRTGFRGNYDVWVMQPDGSHVTQITAHSATDNYPHVSPDGTKILFTSDRDGDDDIYVMNVDGTNIANLTNSSDSETMGLWSPDGSKIAFVGEQNSPGVSRPTIMTVVHRSQARLPRRRSPGTPGSRLIGLASLRGARASGITGRNTSTELVGA
jgi:hypothetical protein